MSAQPSGDRVWQRGAPLHAAQRSAYRAALVALVVTAISRHAVAQDTASPAAPPADATTPSAATDTPPAATPPRVTPWADGVDPSAKNAALAEFRQGNDLFGQSEYLQAAEHYRLALQRWDHPRIHGNLATALIHLDEPLAAMRHLEQALRYGAAPFDAHVFEQLQTNKKLLSAQLARVHVVCEQQGVTISLDGKPALVGPGSKLVLTTAGVHQVVARREGFLTFTEDLTLVGGSSQEVAVELVPVTEVVRYERHWDAWIPWTVLGGGLAVALIGLPLRSAAVSARDQYEEDVATLCPSGCDPATLPSATQDLAGEAETLNGFEIAAYITGGVIAAGGGVLAYLNRERPILAGDEQASLTVVPVISDNTAGVFFGGRF